MGPTARISIIPESMLSPCVAKITLIYNVCPGLYVPAGVYVFNHFLMRETVDRFPTEALRTKEGSQYLARIVLSDVVKRTKIDQMREDFSDFEINLFANMLQPFLPGLEQRPRPNVIVNMVAEYTLDWNVFKQGWDGWVKEELWKADGVEDGENSEENEGKGL